MRIKQNWLIAIFVVCYHPLLIPFPSLNKFTLVLDNIILFMAINIHSFFFASILPIQFLKPLLWCPQTNASFFWTKHVLHFVCCNIIYNILGTDIFILGNFNKVELDTLGYVLIFKDGRMVVAREVKGELARGEVFVNPCPNATSSIIAMTLGFCNKKTCLLPCVFYCSCYGHDLCLEDNINLGVFLRMVSFAHAHCSAGKSW